MEAEEREKLQKQSAILRQELKAWEREFAAANAGRKAGRDDIKQHPSIGMAKDRSRIKQY
jgi:DNA replication regulator SLD2